MYNKLLRFIMGLAIYFGSTSGVFAENTVYSQLVFDFKNGEQAAFLLAEKPTLDFKAGTVTINSGTNIVTYDCSLIDNYHFIQQPTGVVNTPKDVFILQFYDNENLTIKGTKATEVTIFSVEGRKVATKRVSNGEATLCLSGNANGVYIIKLSNGQNFKIYKK